MGKTATLTIHVPSETKLGLEALAETTGRSEALLALEAIERYVEIERWQIAEIEQAVKEADAGKFATDDEVEATFARLHAKYRNV